MIQNFLKNLNFDNQVIKNGNLLSNNSNILASLEYVYVFFIVCVLYINDINSFFLTNWFFLFFNNVNYYDFLLFNLFYFAISIVNLILFSFNIKNFTNISFYNNLYINILYYIYNKAYSFIFLNYIFNYIFELVRYFWNKLYFIHYILITLKNFCFKVFWYPIFKRHSIFGFYKTTRQKWVELKSEEVNFIKY